MAFEIRQFYEHMVINRWIGLIFVSLFGAFFSLFKIWFAPTPKTIASPPSSPRGTHQSPKSSSIHSFRRRYSSSSRRPSDKNNSKPLLSIRILFTIYILCYLSSFIFSLRTFQILLDHYDTPWSLPSEFAIFASIAVFLHIFSMCLYYVIMLRWLHFAFNDSTERINKYHLIIPYGIALCIMSICAILYVYYKAETNLNLKQTKSAYFFPYFLIMTVAINLFVGISIIYLFVSRIRRVVIASDGENTGNKDEKLTHLMTKLTCLGVISIFFMSIDAMTICVYQLIVEEDRSWIAGLILWYSQMFTVWIEIICLFLTFRMNNGLYDKLCCGCHTLFEKWTMWRIETERRNTELQLQMSSVSSLDVQSEDDQYTPR